VNLRIHSFTAIFLHFLQSNDFDDSLLLTCLSTSQQHLSCRSVGVSVHFKTTLRQILYQTRLKLLFFRFSYHCQQLLSSDLRFNLYVHITAIVLWNFKTLQQKLEIKLSPRGTKTGKEGGGGRRGGVVDGSIEMMDKGGERSDVRRNDWWNKRTTDRG
jgi:hypothetical protein